ncbi:MAG: glycosyltransferase family 4 protein [Flavobacteriales bacterium]|nr:glycosyltransferase family 4 protein [Flavobacteriales bacterium]
MLPKQKITYIISGVNRSLAFEWIGKELDRSKFDLEFILLFNGKPRIEKILRQNGSEVHTINYKSKRSIPRALLVMLYLLLKNKPDIVHTHLFEATLLGSVLAKLIGVKKRLQTRHHATSNLIYHPKMVKWDKFNTSLATKIIAPSKNVAKTLVEKEDVDLNKVEVVYHGFKIDEIENVPVEKVEQLRSKYKIHSNEGPIVGVISRYLELKGIQFIIPAFKRLFKDHPNAKLILANAVGPFKNEIRRLLKEIPEDRILEIEFENEIFALYKLFDLFVHVPVNETVEAFGQIYIEALASGIPSIFTLSGVAAEFVRPGHDAVVVDFMNSEEIYLGMKKILSDQVFREQIIENGRKGLSKFEFHHFIKELERLYE